MCLKLCQTQETMVTSVKAAELTDLGVNCTSSNGEEEEGEFSLWAKQTIRRAELVHSKGVLPMRAAYRIR